MLYAIDIETVDSKGEPCLNWRRGSILCIGICYEQYNVKVVKFDSIGKAVIQDILGDSKNSVLFWNAVYDLTWLAQFGVQCLAPVYDVMLLYRLMFNRDDLDCQLRSVAQSLVNMHIPQIEEGLENKVKYDVIATMKIWKELVSILHSKAETERARVWKYFTELIMPNIYVFVSMQLRGLGVDTDLLKEKIKELKAKVEGKLLKLGNKIGNINLNSPKQLSKYIYGQLGAKPISKGDSVSYSVDESVLVQLAKQYPICEEILGKIIKPCQF
jgi:DNA polymerase I-like protein with 3'-5' exonuclease and polymerase domains